MQRRYPQLGDPASLELSTKVIQGELKWPQQMHLPPAVSLRPAAKHERNGQ
ncbi:hypothetical protein [Pseudothauera nasutitermitis]|uniref:hypothetical protein n=1 Tax=Pseudothauera nasutitermitis TaxID=2565930 RepID=UPI001454DAFC|nr:hypothetical protein [Pseudothauera nasutitermitis]